VPTALYWGDQPPFSWLGVAIVIRERMRIAARLNWTHEFQTAYQFED
jgi:hypothetical protein